jgi:hypothetical protein
MLVFMSDSKIGWLVENPVAPSPEHLACQRAAARLELPLSDEPKREFRHQGRFGRAPQLARSQGHITIPRAGCPSAP